MTIEQIAAEVRPLLRHGKDNAVKSDYLAAKLGLKSRTNEKIRDAIRYMVEVHHLCIGSSGSGFYIIDDEQDLTTTTANYRARGLSMLTRAQMLEANYQAERNYSL
jgi:hypothetical protein